MGISATQRFNRYLIRCRALVPIVFTASIYIGVACASPSEIENTVEPTSVIPAPTAIGSSVDSSVTPVATSQVTAAPGVAPTSEAIAKDNVAAAVETTIAEADEEGAGPRQPEWVRARVEALIDIWGFTEEGERWVKGYDLRQMVGEPGWFGSYGFEYWAGVGEAIPRTVLHELSHSYWGAFPIVDGVQLDWQPAGQEPSEGIQQLKADLNEFLTQPTDRFEPLRDRFRNLPNLISGDYPDLYHFGEADLIYSAGGNLSLIPPILRKYFIQALSERGVGPQDDAGLTDWGDAMGWFFGLSNDTTSSPLSDRRIAEETFGLQHFPLSRYTDSEAIYREATIDDESLTSVSPRVRAAVESEEKQRLVDFADQFQLIKSNHNEGSDFSFWRSYLSQMRGLHARYPNVLAETGLIGEELATALDGYIEMERFSPQEQVDWFGQNRETAFVSDFAVLLKPRAILGLFKDADIGEGAQAGLGFKARELALIVEPIDEITQLVSDDLTSAAEMLDSFILGLDEERLRSDVGLIIDLIRGSGSDQAKDLLSSLSNNAYARLFEIAPDAVTRDEVPIGKALVSIGIDDSFSTDSFEAGLKFYSEHSSGNFALDIRIETEIYRLVELLSRDDATRAFSAFAESGMRINPWLESEHSGAMIRRSIPQTAELIMSVEGPRETPGRLLHTLIRLDSILAADVTKHIIANIDPEFGARILRQMAYDAYWLSKGASFAPEPEDARAFLESLIDTYGRGWLDQQIANAVAVASVEEADGDLEPGFEQQLRSTLRAASLD